MARRDMTPDGLLLAPEVEEIYYRDAYFLKVPHVSLRETDRLPAGNFLAPSGNGYRYTPCVLLPSTVMTLPQM
jgi:hypothetical protein